MCDYLKVLNSELQLISKRIYELKDMITTTEDLEKIKELKAELKGLQYQKSYFIVNKISFMNYL